MKNNPKVKSIIGTKFLFDENIISYKDFVRLMEKTELFDTRFIQKPIKDESEVHSIYIKPEFEVAYLCKSPSADEYYKTAVYSCISFRETTLTDFLDDLDLLEYVYESKENEISQEELVENKLSKFKKQKKSKYITILNGKVEFTIKKKNILYISYNNSTQKLYIQFKNMCIESFYMSIEKYLEIKDILES